MNTQSNCTRATMDHEQFIRHWSTCKVTFVTFSYLGNPSFCRKISTLPLNTNLAVKAEGMPTLGQNQTFNAANQN